MLSSIFPKDVNGFSYHTLKYSKTVAILYLLIINSRDFYPILTYFVKNPAPLTTLSWDMLKKQILYISWIYKQLQLLNGIIK